MFFIYTVLYIAALVFVFPFELLKRQKGKRFSWFKEKFGVMPRALNGSIWVHAVSVGEVMAAIPLVEKIMESGLGRNLVISTITDTGRRVAMERLPWAETVYLPFDIPWAIEDAIRALKPHAFILMETELWPNVVRLMKEAGVPVVVANGRISEKSFRNYKMARFFIGRVLGMMRAVCVQDELYAGRALALGADKGLVKVTGNSKFDIAPRLQIPAWACRLEKKHPLIVAGSTHKGEEELVLSAANELKASFPGLTLIVVPRHPERATEVGDIIKKRGQGFVYSSDIVETGAEELPDIIVVDGVGDLFGLYKFSDVAIVCGSFLASKGGQNPLEPAYWSKPIVCGPGMDNFPFMPEMLAAGAAVRAGEDFSSLADIIKDLLADPEKRDRMGKSARQFYDGRTGASARTLEVLKAVLEGEDFPV